MNDLFSNNSLPTNVLENIIEKQSNDIKKLNEKIKSLESNKQYVYKQSTINMMSDAVSKSEKEKLLTKSLLYEIYNSINEYNNNINDILKYKERIEDVFPEVRNNKTL